MSTLNLENIKHPDSASNNISVDSSGRTIVNGNMGIGTSSPTSLLHVQNTSGANIGIQATSGGHWRIGDGVGSTNGNLVIYDYGNSAKRMEIDSAGRVTMPYQPYLRAKGSVNNSVSYSSGDTITHFSVVESQGITYSSGQFTVPVSGKYLFCASVYHYPSSAGDYRFRLNKNGSSIAVDQYEWTSTASGPMDHSFKISQVVTMSANDYFNMTINVGSPFYGGAEHNCVTIMLIG